MTTAARRITAQATWESRLLLRNGEQLLLTVLIPVGLLLLLSLTDVMPSSSEPASASGDLSTSLAIVLTVSIISTAFTSLAIATGFERRAGALRLLATTPLRSRDLLAGKLLATAAVTVLASAIVIAVAVVLGWRPVAGSLWAVPVAVLGVAAWAPWALALAGTLRAEAVLAVANGAFLVIIVVGGVVIPADVLPSPLSTLVTLLPSGALAEALTAALGPGSPDAPAMVVLAAWSAVGSLVATRTFRWT